MHGEYIYSFLNEVQYIGSIWASLGTWSALHEYCFQIDFLLKVLLLWLGSLWPGQPFNELILEKLMEISI